MILFSKKMTLQHKQINYLIIISIIIYSTITKSGDHVSIPMFFLLPFSIIYFAFEDFIYAIIPLLSFSGIICLLLYIKYEHYKKSILVLIGYILSFIEIFYLLYDAKVYEYYKKQWWFFLSISLYLSLSFFVIYKLYKNKKNSSY